METDVDRAVAWAVAHLSEHEAVFARTDLLAATLAWSPGAVAIGEAKGAAARLEKGGALQAANLPVLRESLTTDKAIANEKETIALMLAGRERGAVPKRGRAVDKALRNGPLTAGQKEAVKLILSDKDRVVGVHRGAYGLRGFRNYIHPYEQLVSRFTPDEHTAKVCFQVLKAALASATGERR